jgi:hypothetical protein
VISMLFGLLVLAVVVAVVLTLPTPTSGAHRGESAVRRHKHRAGHRPAGHGHGLVCGGGGRTRR